MYKFTRNTQILCFALMSIGLVAIIYGFYTGYNSLYSDKYIESKKLNSKNKILLFLIFNQLYVFKFR